MAGLCAAVTVLGAVARVSAAESAATANARRMRSAVLIGAGLMRGRSALRAAPTEVDARIDGLPRLSLGAELWPVEHLGFRVGVDVGLGATLAGPDGGPTVDLNESRFEGLARYRAFFGARSDAPALLVGTGVRVDRTSVTHREPALLVDRLVAGPVAELAFEYPTMDGDLCARATALAGLPFFVQEPHRDTGDPSGRLSWGGRFDVTFRALGRWGVWTSVDVASTALDFRGEGTRALGTQDASTADVRVQGLAGVRWSLVSARAGESP